VLRVLRTAGVEIAASLGARFTWIGLDWTPDHPLLRVASANFGIPTKDFTWQVRIAGLPGFIRLIAPVLERRLAESPLAGYDGELLIAVYPNGLRLWFDAGRLAVVEALPTVPHRNAGAAFPGLTFLNLVLGSRTVAELAHAFPGEAWTRTELTQVLLDTIFPKAPSTIWPVA